MAHILHNNLVPKQFLISNLHELINISIENDSLDKLIIVLPTGRLVRLYKRFLIHRYFEIHQKPLTKFKLHTLNSLIKFCFDCIYKNVNYRIISDSFRVYLFEEAAKRANFSFYQNKNLSGAIIKKMSNIIMGLKSDGIYFDSISKEINSEIQSNEIFDISRYEDISKLYYHYHELLGDKLIDQQDIIRLVNEYLMKISHSHPYIDLSKEDKISQHPLNTIFSQDSIIALTGFSQFRVPEIEFLSHFAISLIPILIHIDYSKSNGPLFGNLIDTLRKLELAGFSNIDLEETENTNTTSTKSSYLRRWLFNSEQNIENDSFRNQIKIFPTKDKTSEVYSIAKLIRWCNQVYKIPLNEICIVMRQPELYTNLFRDIFRISGIPANITDRFELSQSPISIAIVNILDAIIYNFNREKFIKALKSKYLNFSNQNENKIDPENLYSIALELKINNTYGLGIEFWENRIHNRLNYWKNQNSIEYDNENYDYYDIQQKIARFNKALNDIKILKELFGKVPKKLKPNEFSEFIQNNIINQLQIRSNLINSFYSEREKLLLSPVEANFAFDEIEKEGRALSLIINLLNEMTSILNELYPDRTFSFDELVNQFKTIIANGRYQILEKYQYGVTVTSIEQTRGIPYKVLILCGANDGRFPIPYRTETFLGKELVNSEAKHKEAERMLFYQFLTNNITLLDNDEQRIYIFYPKYDGENELIRSPFINELLKILSQDESKYVYDIEKLMNLEQIQYDFKWINALITPVDVIINLDSIDTDKIIDKLQLDYRFKDWYQELSNPERFKLKFESNKINDGNLAKLNDKERQYLSIKKRKPISPTELEIYAKCPYLYFVNRILNVQQEEQPEIQLTRLEQGNILHNILYKFYKKIQSEANKSNNITKIKPNKQWLPEVIPVKLKNDELLHYREIILDFANEELKKFQFDNLFYEINYAELIGDEGNPGLILIWLQNEIIRTNNGWKFNPALFEFSFGRENSGQGKEQFTIEIDGKFKISGKIDRVEINDDLNEFIIADYKISYSAYLPSDNAIKNGRSFQMPFYLIAMERIFKDYYNCDLKFSGGVYYPIKPGFDNKKKQSITEKTVLIPQHSSLSKSMKVTKEYDLILASSINYALDYLNKIEQGKFPVQPLNSNICSNCTFSNICRINDRR